MKKQLIALMISGTLSAAAYAAPASHHAVNADPRVPNAVITHVGSTSESLVFQVNLANQTGERFTLIIRDNTGTTLYRGAFSDKNFSKKFQLPKGDSDKIVFVIRSASGNSTESFEVNSNTRLVEEVVVRRVN